MITPTTTTTSSPLRSALVSALRQVGNKVDINIPRSPVDQRKLLGDLVIASQINWGEEALELFDRVWNEEKTFAPIVDVSSLDVSAGTTIGSTRVVVWKGDITTLGGIDTIVNPANDAGLGCFQPQHKCLDNIIHRGAGPRLRLACQRQMSTRSSSLSVGTEPLFTNGFHLPARHVLHVTGPQVPDRSSLEPEHEQQLSLTYRNILNTAAENRVSSMAIPCISTGLFGFPQDRAAAIAVDTVKSWLKENTNKSPELIVLNVFTDEDLKHYNREMTSIVEQSNRKATSASLQHVPDSVQLASNWIRDADSVLIVAGAGMSVKEGEMVYVSPQDFARHYPWFTKYGYRTSYEGMGLLFDTSVPETAKWGYHAAHINNQRWAFTPNTGYDSLKEIVSQKNYFVLTSNVDACFERKGFDQNRIYTPQGEWTYFQCTRPCRPDSVFASRPYLDKMLASMSSDGTVPENTLPKCPNCGGPMFGNVRGGSWFLHQKYESKSRALESWMDEQTRTGQRVVVLEIGAGFNTPTVTRLPAEAFVRSLGDNGRLIRINPTEPHVPEDLHAVALKTGWEVLEDLLNYQTISDTNQLEENVRESQKNEGYLLPRNYASRMGISYSTPDWRRYLQQLRR